jgi:hypothetical protein
MRIETIPSLSGAGNSGESMAEINKPHQGNKLKRLMGAIQSKHPAAYLGVAIKTIAPMTRSVDRIAQYIVRQYSSPHSTQVRCAFIVCPPRSGGTVIYQALTRAISSVYLSNAHALFPSLGSRLLRSRHERLKAYQSFNNYYGYTPHLFDVYEGNEFFDWAHRVPPGVSGDECNQYLRTEFGRLIKFLAPLPCECVIFKNARAYSVVERLHRAVPEIVFVRVRRDRTQVVESVVRAFHELGSFHPVPDSVRVMEIEDPVEFAFAQIEAIEARLDEQFSRLPSSSRFEIPYEAFCERPYEFINALAYDVLKLPPGSVRKCSALARLRASRRRKVSDAERLGIQVLIQKREQGEDPLR